MLPRTRCSWTAWLAVGLVAMTVLAFPSMAVAGAPGHLEDLVTRIAREDADGKVAWARYVATTADTAAALLGRSREQLSEGTPDRVSLVLMRGDFSLQDVGEGRGPYLAFLYWRGRDTWNATDFTVLRRPVRLESAGTPQPIETFLLAHPTLNRSWPYVAAGFVLLLPPVLLVVSAVLCAWRRRSGWPYVLATCVAVAVAAWQTYLAARSMSGQSWDPVFHGIKLSALAAVMIVDLAAAAVLLRARSRISRSGPAGTHRTARLPAGFVLPIVAAILYVAAFPWLATTGE